MTHALALEIIEKEMEEPDGFAEVEFDFHGGEPFLEFGLIREVCESIWARNWRRPYLFFATTNGVLVHDEIREWLWRNRARVWCCLSLDGPRRVHDTNRPDSFDRIDVDFFRDAWPSQTMKMTVSPATIGSLSDSVIWMHENQYQFTCNLACGIDWSESARAVLAEQIDLLIDYYSRHRDIQPCNLLASPIELAPSHRRTSEIPQWCGIGRSMKAFDTDGRSYPCQSLIPFTDGGSSSPSGIPLDGIDPFSSMPLDCRDCCVQTFCRTCYAANFGQRGDPTLRDPMDCYVTRLLAQATATLTVRYMSDGEMPAFLVQRSNREKVRLCDGASKVLADIGRMDIPARQ